MTPITAGTRDTFPIYLNVLAVADRAEIESPPFRV